MGPDFDPVAYNRAAWDRQVDSGNEWTRPVASEVIERARAGEWTVVLTGYQPVDRSWFPENLSGVDILCLASGGGQQAPVLAATGATVTSYDNSPRQLAQDEYVARRDGLELTTVLGDMRDLSAFPTASFDMVFNPVSNVFCPELAPVWRECYRVLRRGGTLLTGFMNPDVYIFDDEEVERGELIGRNQLPRTVVSEDPTEPIQFSHTMVDQIGGMLAAGFRMTGFTEHRQSTRLLFPEYYACRAVKP